jgi:uridine kinase
MSSIPLLLPETDTTGTRPSAGIHRSGQSTTYGTITQASGPQIGPSDVGTSQAIVYAPISHLFANWLPGRIRPVRDPEQQPLPAADPEEHRSYEPLPSHSSSQVANEGEDPFPPEESDLITPVLFIKHDTAHLDYFPGENRYLPTSRLMWRTLEKLLRGGAGIAVETMVGFGMTYLTAQMTNSVLGALAGHDEGALRNAIVDASTLIAHTRNGILPTVISEQQALGLSALNLAVNYYQAQNGSQGAQYAVAQMFVSRITVAMEAVFQLAKKARPTRVDDFRKVFFEFHDLKRSVIEKMPPYRRNTYNLVEGEIKGYWRGATSGNISIDQLTHCRHLMETLEVLVKSYESSLYVPANIWQFDEGDTAAAKKFSDLTEEICTNVDPDGAEAVRSFMKNHRLKTVADWTPTPENKGASDMNVLVLAGVAGSGKSYVSKLAIRSLNCKEVPVLFSDVLRHLGGEEKKDSKETEKDSDTAHPSPTSQFKTFKKLLYIEPGSIVRMEEANLVGTGPADARTGFKPIDYDYLDRIKRKWEPNDKYGLFRVKGYPDGVYFLVDLRRVSFIITTNNVPNDQGLSRRFGIAYCNQTPEPKRREIALDTALHYFTQTIPKQYRRSLTPVQVMAIKGELAGAMEYIIKEGKKDAGPQMMQIVILDYVHELAQAYALGTRHADEQAHGDASLLENPESTMVGLKWKEASEPDPEIQLSIRGKFKKHRGLDVVNNLLDEAKKALISWDSTKPLPDTKHYLTLATGNRTLSQSPKDMITFLISALSQQWDSYLDKRPEDIRKSVENLKKEALSCIIYIWDGAQEKHGWGFQRAEYCAQLMDSIMRIPSRPKNLSYWEKGGNIEQRKEMESVKVRIRGRFVGGAQSGTSVSNFVQRTVDNTFPFSDEMTDKNHQRAVLYLSGPLGTNPTEQAKRIYADLGLHPIVMTLEEYINLFETDSGKDDPRQSSNDKTKIRVNLDTLLGRLKPLLQGDHYNCGIVISNTRFDQTDILDKARRYLAPNALNPKISLSDVEKCEFEIPLTEISVILTSDDSLQDPNLKHAMWEERIEKISENDRRGEVQVVVASELAKLDQYDIPFREKENIRDTVDRMMRYCLQNNMDKDAGSEPLLRAVRSLFSELSVRARTSMMGSESNTSTQEDKRHLDAGFTLSWQDVARNDLPSDLVDMVDNMLAGYRSIQVSDKRPAATTRTMGFPPPGVVSSLPHTIGTSTVEELRKLPAQMDGLRRDVTAALASLADIVPEGLGEFMKASEASSTTREKFRQTTLETYFVLPLFKAAEMGDIEMLKQQLLRPDLRPNRSNTFQQTALHLIALNHQLEACEVFLADSRVNTCLMAKNDAGRTPLHIVCDDKQHQMARLILAAGAEKAGVGFDVNHQDKDGATALALAASSGSYEAAEAVLGVADADASVPDNSKHTVYHRAIGKGDSRMLNLLMEKRPISPELRKELTAWAVEQDKLEIARSLLARSGIHELERNER